MKSAQLIAFVLLLFIVSSQLFVGCKTEQVIDYNKKREDSLRTLVTKSTDSLIAIFNKRPPSYKILKLKGKSLGSKYNSYGQDIILALNRMDKKFLKKRDTLVVPDTIVNNFLYYSPLPIKISNASFIPKLIVISQEIQAFGAYEFGNLVKWGPVSTGKIETPTKNGLFHTNWKAKETKSTFNDEWDLKWNFNLDNFEGISLHQYELPGFPASHACARMRAADAEWIYYWAEQWIVTKDEGNIIAYGTPVLIFGDYDFNSPKVWRKLADDYDSAVISESELEGVVNTYAGTIKSRKNIREYLTSKHNDHEQKPAKKKS